MMAAIVSNSRSDVHEKERQRLLSELLGAVKQCQARFGGRSELATEGDHLVSELCQCLEAVLNHGLRSRPLQKNPTTLEQVTGMVASTFRYSQEPPCFWHYVRQHLNRHELERFLALKEIWTDVGRGRAWLRSSLNERSLNRYMHVLLSDPGNASVYYHEWALLLDQELNSTLPDIAAGLSPIFFAIGIKDKRLNENCNGADFCQLSRSEPILAMPIEETQVSHRRRKTTAQVISFENDPEDESLPEDSYAAPASCLSTSAQSASILCSSTPMEQKSFAYPDGLRKFDGTSHSSNDSSFQDFDALSKIESIVEEKPVESRRTLIPVSDNVVGELIVITGEDVTQDITVDSDDASSESLLNIKFEEPLKAEDIETVLNALEEVKDLNSGLKTKLMAMAYQKKEENVKLQNQLHALTRENEVLKHQLRKYVEAVQMLNKDGSAAHEALACFDASKEGISDKEEAVQYEKKLVLVAEMHGELMEFNDRLQRVIQAKEKVIKRLERELTDLRGPLPSVSLWEDGVVAVPETLINICIPSAFLTGGSSDVHHVYQVCIRIRDTEWNIYRRYTQFYALHKELKKEYPVVGSLDFPPKKTVGNKDAKFVEDRRIRLQRYLRQLVDVISRYKSDLADPNSLCSVIPFFSHNTDKTEKPKTSQKSRFGRRKKQEPVYDPSQYNGRPSIASSTEGHVSQDVEGLIILALSQNVTPPDTHETLIKSRHNRHFVDLEGKSR